MNALTVGIPSLIFDGQFMRRLLIALIKGYQALSRYFPARCRFYPTCSNYTIEALRKHGIVTGLWLALKRVCHCHPWNPGGVDLVPEPKRKKSEKKRQKSKIDLNERSD